MKKGRPTPPRVSPETWQALLKKAVEYQRLAPWQWMTNYAVLGMHDAASGKIRFADVLGNAGEVFGLVIYRGALGVRILLETLWNPQDEHPLDLLFNMDAIKLEFVDRDELRPEELALYKQLRFKPALRQPLPWPNFQSFVPGYLPWFLDQTEAELLLGDLGKAIRFARLVRDTPDLYAGRKPNEVPFVPGDPRLEGPARARDLTWHQLQAPQELPPEPFPAHGPQVLKLRAKGRQPNFACEMDSFYLNNSVWDAERPYFTKVALLVDANTGYVYGFKLSGAKESLEQTAGDCLMQVLPQLERLPEKINLPTERLRLAVQPLAKALGVRVNVRSNLPMLKEARKSMENYFRKGE